jgi:ABC-type transport system involved in multi-copper enzyme maturation permease subunit
MKKLWFIMIIVLAMIPSLVSASYVSFADPDSTTHKDVFVYNSTGNLIGSYNTTSTGIDLTGAGDVMFVLKPQYTNPLEDPGAFTNGLLLWFRSYLDIIIIISIVVAIFWKR